MALPAVIERRYADTVIEQRVKDGYFNATAMCQAAGKKFHDYRRLKVTEAFLKALEAKAGIPVSEQIQSLTGGNAVPGSWIEPRVAANLAQWLSPEFAVDVADWIVEWKMIPQAANQLGDLQQRVDQHEVRLNEHGRILNEHGRILTEVNGNVIAVKQWTERQRLPQDRRFSDDVRRAAYLVIHLDFNGHCPIDKIKRITDDDGRPLAGLTELDHWHGPQYNKLENAFPASTEVHKKLSSSQEFRTKHQAIFEYFQHCVRQRIEQGKLLRHKSKKQKCSSSIGKKRAVFNKTVAAGQRDIFS